MPRKLRIAVSVFFGVLTVALCVLWARSYWRWDRLIRDAPQEQQIQSSRGQIQISWQNQALPGTLRTAWTWEAFPQKVLGPKPAAPWKLRLPRVVRSTRLTIVSIPHWTPTLLYLALTVVPIFSLVCRNARFSLRTLLVATTLVAVVLGLGVWLAS